MKIPVPAVSHVFVGKGRNTFGADSPGDKEVSLDVQVLAGVAPEARLAIYFTENNEIGLADGVIEAIHDSTHRPSVIVITWGEPEVSWSSAERRAARTALDAALTDAVRLGITVVAAAGDDLATDRIVDNKAHVDYPASILSCGGTRITLDASGTAITDEVVWNDGLRGTGGGISDLFLVPEFQKSAQVPPSVNDGRLGRGVPDAAAAASETNGYRIFLHGSEITTGSTSAAGPLWGAFIALLNEQRGKSLALSIRINPVLYRDPGLLRPIIFGDNAIFGIGYKAGPGWSACTGLALGLPNNPTLPNHETIRTQERVLWA
jgi:kumamolisin